MPRDFPDGHRPGGDGLHADAVACRNDRMSADEWEKRARTDPAGHILGERAIVAISALVWGWDHNR